VYDNKKADQLELLWKSSNCEVRDCTDYISSKLFSGCCGFTLLACQTSFHI